MDWEKWQQDEERIDHIRQTVLNSVKGKLLNDPDAIKEINAAEEKYECFMEDCPIVTEEGIHTGESANFSSTEGGIEWEFVLLKDGCLISSEDHEKKYPQQEINVSMVGCILKVDLYGEEECQRREALLMDKWRKEQQEYWDNKKRIECEEWFKTTEYEEWLKIQEESNEVSSR